MCDFRSRQRTAECTFNSQDEQQESVEELGLAARSIMKTYILLYSSSVQIDLIVSQHLNVPELFCSDGRWSTAVLMDATRPPDPLKMFKTNKNTNIPVKRSCLFPFSLQ